nr:MAG TPA: hypothetical protein [Caudoviricetes sp.]
MSIRKALTMIRKCFSCSIYFFLGILGVNLFPQCRQRHFTSL